MNVALVPAVAFESNTRRSDFAGKSCSLAKLAPSWSLTYIPPAGARAG
jgi:hypothetical protein